MKNKKDKKIKQRQALINNIQKMLDHISDNKKNFVSDEGKISTCDYGNGEEFSMAYFYDKIENNKLYRLAYRFYCSVTPI